MKIPTGTMPHRDAVIRPVGDPQGAYQGYVAHVYRPSNTTTYAGVGKIAPDSIHFAPEAWDSEPSTPRTARKAAVGKAENAQLAEWKIVLPEDLF